MSELKPYICTQCGGKVNRATLVCEMCGTQFREDVPYRLIVSKPGTHVLGTQRSIDNEMLHLAPEELSKMVLEDMAKQLASCLVPFMDVQTEQNLQCNQTIIRSRLRVLDPTFRF